MGSSTRSAAKTFKLEFGPPFIEGRVLCEFNIKGLPQLEEVDMREHRNFHDFNETIRCAVV